MNINFIFEQSNSLSEEEISSLKNFSSLIASPFDRQEEIFDFLKKNEIQGETLSQSLKNWFLHIKENYKESFEKNPVLVFLLYKCISFLNYDDFKSIFPAKKAVTEQNIYDYSTEIFKSKSADEAVSNFAKSFVSSAFSVKNINKNRSENYDDDLRLLQKLFFFLLWDLSSPEDEVFFSEALKSCWYSSQTLSELFNKLKDRYSFNSNKNVLLVDFTDFKGVHFEQNESVLRLLYNFTRPDFSIKEGIISQLNFIREQQKAILPICPNTRRDNYSPAQAKAEINQARNNLVSLKNLDSGFTLNDFTQTFLINDEDRRKTFVRPIKCKCFQETELKWKQILFKSGRIYTRKSVRNMIKKSLDTKFLYPERNKITHVGENYAVFQIFTRDYKGSEKEEWKETVLQAFYDARRYLQEFGNQELARSLLNILDFFFEKVCQPLNLTYNTVLELWVQVFDQNGEVNLTFDKLHQTNINNTLSERELSYLKKFLGFLYCSENLTQDFISQYKKMIQVYLIYLRLELSKMDK